MLTQGAGIDPVNDITSAEALRAQDILGRKREDVLVRGYDFNIDQIDLNRQVDGTIVIPDDYLSVKLPEPYEVRNGKVYDPTNRTFEVGRDFPNTDVALDLPFEQLPHSAARAIAWEACEEFCASVRSAGSPQYAYCAQKSAEWGANLSSKYPAPLARPFGAGAGRYYPSKGQETYRWQIIGS